jgi:GntR family transcriptional regulator / MocR family aminotransferase
MSGSLLSVRGGRHRGSVRPAACRSALRDGPDGLLGYADPRGLPQLRAALAGYLARTRGVVAHPDQVFVCAGFSHGLALLSRVLRARGSERVAMESYGSPAHRRIVEQHGLQPVSQPVDSEGADPASLDGSSAAFLTPAHQFPLGVTLRPERRRAFVDWAARTGGLVIEDDYDGEFRYDRQPVGAMQALAPQHVVYAGTASKNLAPGLRLAWLVVPATLVDELSATAETIGVVTSSLDQLTLAHLIASGGYDRQARAMRNNYRCRRDRLVGAMQSEVPQARIAGIAAGLQALVELPYDQSESEIVTRATEHGLLLEGLNSYTIPGEPQRAPALVVGYARPPEHAYTTALARLCAVLSP